MDGHYNMSMRNTIMNYMAKKPKDNVNVVDAPKRAAVEWIMNMYTLLSKEEFEKRYKEIFLKALEIQEQMVRHAYNFGWDDGYWEIKESFEPNADERFYMETYGQKEERDNHNRTDIETENII